MQSYHMPVFLRVGICNRKFENADFRVFELDGSTQEGEDGPRLVEWDLTESKGGGLGKSLKGTFGWEENDFKYMPKKGERVEVSVSKMAV